MGFESVRRALIEVLEKRGRTAILDDPTLARAWLADRCPGRLEARQAQHLIGRPIWLRRLANAADVGDSSESLRVARMLGEEGVEMLVAGAITRLWYEAFRGDADATTRLAEEPAVSSCLPQAAPAVARVPPNVLVAIDEASCVAGIVVGEDRVEVWKLAATPTLLHRIDIDQPIALAIQPGGRRVAVANADGVAVHAIPGERPTRRRLTGVTALAWLNEHVVCGRANGTVGIWDDRMMMCQATPLILPAQVAVIATGAGRMAAGAIDGTVASNLGPSGFVLQEGAGRPVAGMAISLSGSRLAAVVGPTLCVFDAVHATYLWSRHVEGAGAVAWTHDDRHIAVVRNRSIEAFGRLATSRINLLEAVAPIRAIAPSAGALVVVLADGEVSFLDVLGGGSPASTTSATR